MLNLRQDLPITGIVYIVDDHAELASSLDMLLRGEGFGTRLFASADLLLEAIDTLPAGCILMDLYMPGSDGIEGLQQIRAKGIDWPVILMSGNAEDNDEDLAWACGAVQFLHKPFDGDALIRTVSHFLAPPGGPA